MTINVTQTREKLQRFDLRGLFVEELGWNRPPRGLTATTWRHNGLAITRTPIAELAGVVVFEIATADGSIPEESVRRSTHVEVARYHLEHLLIFLNAERTSSLWYWVKREGSKSHPRRHIYVQGQSGDLLIAKLSAMFIDISELDPASGSLRLVEAIKRVREALDVEPVTKRFFNDFQKLREKLLEAVGGITDERDRRWYASVLLSRLMFVYFLQQRGFLDGGNYRYLRQQLLASQQRGDDRYYAEFLRTLFFEGFAKPADERSTLAQHMIGDIRYLNGGLFLPHQIEQRYHSIQLPDRVFTDILDLFEGYDWVLSDSPSGNEINPVMLGYIFEKYINQKAFGAYYTRTEITEYLCEQTIHRLVLERVNRRRPAHKPAYETVGDLLLKAEINEVRFLLLSSEGLKDLRLIDPACGSGAFLVAAMRTLIEIYSALVGRAKFSKDRTLEDWLAKIEHSHPNIDYFIKKQIIINNLYGVDIMAEAVEIARLRLFLALVASARTVDDLEPLPNIDFNILTGNALIGLLWVDEQRADQKAAQQAVQQLDMFTQDRRDSYLNVVAEKNRLVGTYRSTTDTLRSADLSALRDNIQHHRIAAAELLDRLLLDDFQTLGIRYEEATWDAAKGKEGKPKRRPLLLDDIRQLQPFHWGYEFDEVMNQRGGFDAIITNPPWEALKPEAKEFFAEYSNLVSKKKMTIKEFEQEQSKLLQDRDLHDAWLAYLSRFPYQSEYFRLAPQFRHQSTIVGGKKTGTDINFYKLFVEQCFNLLRDGGQCGIVVPSGIYTDMGTTGLRKLLFEHNQVRSILSVSNERFLFESVHHSFRYVLLTCEKGGETRAFSASFRINPREAVGPEQIDAFLNTPSHHLAINLDVVRHLSPETLSVMEFRSKVDVDIAQKMLRHPAVGKNLSNNWNLVLTNEFHMTNDSYLFKDSYFPGRIPLFEGKMIHQFIHARAEPKYWIDEDQARTALVGKNKLDTGKTLDYQRYRLAFREIARNSDERSMIATILPQNVFANHKLMLSDLKRSMITNAELVFCTAVLNSLALDYLVRQRIATSISMFIFYQLPVPRLTERDPRFGPIVERAARLICTTPAYDALAAEVGLGDHRAGTADPAERNRLRAELDALVAHLYDLTEAELVHILGTFPLVEEAQKDAVLSAFRISAPNPDDAQVAGLIAGGESARVEFKVALAWNAALGKKDMTMRDNVVQGVAAFMNSRDGGTLIIGVDKHGSIVGITDDIVSADPGKPNHDGYELFIRNSIGSAVGASVTLNYDITFHSIGAQQVCRIAVQPAEKPVYVQGDLYVRDGNSKKKLNAQQALEYIRQRWPE